MPLTEEELEAQLAEIRKKKEGGKSGPGVNISIDMSDPKAVRRAMKLGYIDQADLEDDDSGGKDDDDDDGKDGDDKDETPRRGKGKVSLRKGYGDE